jgi:hypothetical protein
LARKPLKPSKLKRREQQQQARQQALHKAAQVASQRPPAPRLNCLILSVPD